MVSHQTPLDLSADDNVILINPRFPKVDFDKLYSLAESVQGELGLQAHVWIATSGSTADSVGSTKLVALSKKALIASAISVNRHLQVTAEDIWTQVLPHFHVGGLGIEVRAELAGSRVVPSLKDGKWSAQHFCQTILTEKCTLSALVPSQVYDLVALNLRAPETIRAMVVGGGVMDVPLYEQARALGWPILPSYGMTETASQIATASLASLKGKDYPAIELLSHAEARSNEEGFLEVKASSLFTCYAQNMTDGARYWDPKSQGWFISEDRGEVRGKALKISGRSSDYVKIGGEGTNVARLRAVLECAAFELNPRWPLHITLLDMPSERLGAEIHAVTTLRSSEVEQIVNLYGEKVLPYEKIRKIHVVAEIPRTDLGKIQWSALRRTLC